MTSSNDAVPKPAAAPAPVFSYAQAARGLVSTSSSVQSSRGTSGVITPAKDSVASPVVLPENPAWTDKSKEPVSEPNELSLTKSANARKSLAHSNGSISPPSSAYVDSSMSTLPREDDLSSIPNASSESTWENVSTASNAAERGSESDAKKPEVNGDREPGWVQVSKPSPQPAFNYWEQRSKEMAAKKVVNSGPDAPAVAAIAKPPPQAAVKPQEPVTAHKDDAKRDHRSEDEPRGRRPAKKTVPDEKPSAPPAINDANLWPTVETALVDRKKPDKAEKPEKTEKEKPLAKKTEWKKVEVQHSVVFNTPLPTSRGRGGRPTGRGGREGGTRSSPGGPAEKSGDSKPRSTSPGKGKRVVSDDGHKRDTRFPARDQKEFGDRPARQNSDDRNGGPYGTFPRAKANRKVDDAEKRKDGRVISDLSNGEGLAIENANPPNQQRSSQVHSDDEPRSSANDGNPRSQRNGAPYTANRRGSLRRHGPPHGFHGTPSPAFQAGGFNMARSPTLPHDGYYTPGPGNRIRGQRNQMAGDNYGRFGAPYSAVLPQINTFMGQPVGVFDFQPPHPASAGAFPPYIDQYTHIGMVASQLYVSTSFNECG
jgi:la-related protein 1